jgi:hypothetical protein
LVVLDLPELVIEPKNAGVVVMRRVFDISDLGYGIFFMRFGAVVVVSYP